VDLRPSSAHAVFALSLALAATVLALGTRDPFWNGDFLNEAWPAYMALAAGDVGGFVSRAPAYSGFLVLVGAPVVEAVHHTIGGVDAIGRGVRPVYVLTAVPGVLALAALGAALAGRVRRALPGSRLWLLVAALGAGSPIAYQALLYGHPEDVLAASLCVLGVLAARGGRPTAAGVVLALAIVAKQWAVLAVLPAMLAADSRALRIGVIAGAGAVVALAPLLALTPASHGPLVSSGALFHPHQVWWPLGVPADAAHILAGHGERTAPAWLTPITHPLIVLLALPLSALWWLRAGRGARDRDDAFGLLALLFLERCALDPWNLVYYQLPLVLSLLAWEVHRRRGLPVVTLAVTAATWLSFVTYDERGGYGPFAAYLAWALPLGAWLAWTLYRPAGPRAALTGTVRRWPLPQTARPPRASRAPTACSPSSSSRVR
jgi:hypothetical protein